MEKDSPAISFEAPEGAAEGFAGRVAGDVGEQRQLAGEALALEVFTRDWVRGLGGECREEGGAVPDDAGGAEFAEFFG